MRNTKDRILDVALDLFAKDGFDAVSVESIATAVGIKAPSLYKHYKSKRAIFLAILQKMQDADTSIAIEKDVPSQSITINEESYENVNLEDLRNYSKQMFLYWTVEPFSSNFRKVLTLEQYKSDEMAFLYSQYLSRGPLEYLKDIFSKMPFIKDPKETALRFYGPMFLLYYVYDTASDKEDVIKSLNDHIDALCEQLLTDKRKYQDEHRI